MANAGCINAYDCNGCLIQTLQNLDSACIGVGVQYTAPNPLDDKRLDYIKYTDKCGCVQCLSGENEILIYATNGVIKNLTLTNDDVNEAIKIKWNDIFGSNRAKTIVRYKTGSAPVSITDGTLAVEETTKNQYSSTPYSLTGVLDETTYYISAFAVDSNGTIIDMQTKNITTSFAFAGYQKVEYIQSHGSGTWGEYINTGLYANQVDDVEMEFSYPTLPNVVISMAGAREYTIAFTLVRIDDYNRLRPRFGEEIDTGITISANTKYKCRTTYVNGNQKVYVNDTLKGSSTQSLSYQNTRTSTIFGLNDNNGITYKGSFKLYHYSMKKSGNLVRNFYPVYRKSDNVIGLLDIVNKQFYTNQGSGSFTKGPNV